MMTKQDNCNNKTAKIMSQQKNLISQHNNVNCDWLKL